ncbi:MAG: MerR family transcriptional regulator [Bacteroidota bacterium]
MDEKLYKEMLSYTIKDLERLSGVKAHTLRIWEQRYNILNPNRTDTNIRLYSNNDLKRLLNVSILNNNGYKISKIANLSEVEINDAVLTITKSSTESNTQVDTLIIAMTELDEDRFDKAIATNILKVGLEKTIVEVVYPFLDKVGIMWQTGTINPAQEHFISNLIRQKLIVAIDGQLNTNNPKAKRFLLYLPEKELHEISLLFYAYIIKASLNKLIYLGQSVPYEDLSKVVEIYQPHYIATIVTVPLVEDDLQNYVNKLCAKFPKSTVLLSGYQIVNSSLEIPKNAIVFKNYAELKHIINPNVN